MFKRLFGQKPEEEPKRDKGTAQEQTAKELKQDKGTAQEQTAKELKQDKGTTQEQTAKEPVPGQRFNFLQRTRQLFNRMGSTVEQTDIITDALWDELEEDLLAADVGPHTAELLMDRLRQRVTEEHMQTGAQVQRALREELTYLLGKPSPLRFAEKSPLTVILVIGVNGSGKTTTCAKLAYRLTAEGHRVMMAAADTFRAGAIEQLKIWGERVQVPVISQNPGSDPGAVVYDAIQAAQTRGCDVLIVDTAGRLQTKYNLMEELKKINKVIQKFIPDGPDELLIVIDATTGQNALLQARQFAADVGLSGVIVAKLDSTAKGGFAFAVADDLGVPIKFIGTGEKIENLVPFEPQQFVAALFAQN